jgi:hypothetical protein
MIFIHLVFDPFSQKKLKILRGVTCMKIKNNSAICVNLNMYKNF